MTKIFDDWSINDKIELDLKLQISETQRTMLQKMFISSENAKIMLNKAMVNATKEMNISHLMEIEAKKAIEKSITHYFTYGKGFDMIQKVINQGMNDSFKEIFKNEQ